jgi:hypothetical protein
MPSRRSNELEAAALPAGDPFATLPHALALVIFSLLPVDQRMRCAEVCRGWRAMLSDVNLWLRLDLSPAGGVARDAVTKALLRAAAKRAAGRLQALDLSDCERFTHKTICAVAAKNAGALVELRLASPAAALPRTARFEELQLLLQAAPQLHMLETYAACWNADSAHRLLRNEAPFGPLRVRRLPPRTGPRRRRSSAHLRGGRVCARVADRPFLDACSAARAGFAGRSNRFGTAAPPDISGAVSVRPIACLRSSAGAPFGRLRAD